MTEVQGEVMSTANQIGMRDYQSQWQQWWVADRAIRLAYYLVDGSNKNGIAEAYDDLQRAITHLLK